MLEVDWTMIVGGKVIVINKNCAYNLEIGLDKSSMRW